MLKRESVDILSSDAIIPAGSYEGAALKIGVIADTHGNLAALE